MNNASVNLNDDHTAHRVDVYYLCLQQASNPISEKELGILSGAEREHMTRLRNAVDRNSYARAHILLRQTLANYLDIPAAELRFEKTNAGKPILVSQRGSACIEFNLTHCESMVACAVSHTPVGIDIEPRDRFLDDATIEHILHETELRYLSGLKLSERRSMAIEYWTCKEAALKALGIGLFVEPNQIMIVTELGAKSYALLPKSPSVAQTRVELFSNLLPHSQHALCLASLGSIRPTLVVHECVRV